MIITALQAEPLDTAALVDQVRRDDAGAVVVFEGTVRSPNRGKVVLRLEYEAYETVARQQLQTVAEAVATQHGLSAALAVHRVGPVNVGESAVVVVAVSAHRGAAFDGARELIDRVKAEVAIWKREVLEDGAFWVEEH